MENFQDLFYNQESLVSESIKLEERRKKILEYGRGYLRERNRSRHRLFISYGLRSVVKLVIDKGRKYWETKPEGVKNDNKNV